MSVFHGAHLEASDTFPQKFYLTPTGRDYYFIAIRRDRVESNLEWDEISPVKFRGRLIEFVK